jgi:hypothetical protein
MLDVRQRRKVSGMDKMDLIQFFLILANVGLILMLVFMRGYLVKKGENLATKEDIGDITKEIEIVRISLGSQLHVHRVRYEKEFDILLDLSEHLVELQASVLGLRPTTDWNPPDRDDEEKIKRLTRFSDAFYQLRKNAASRRPFYPQDIYESVDKLTKVAFSEAFEFSHFSREDRRHRAKDYWERAEKNAEEITSLAEEVLNKIRERVKTWEHIPTDG